MLSNEQKIRCYACNWLRHCIAVTAFVTLGLATNAFANISRNQVLDFHGQAATSFAILATNAEVDDGPVVQVGTIEELYAAVNNPANAGAAIILAPGRYVLSSSGPGGVARPNGGRLELLQDMSLYGVAGDRSAVVIDTSLLPQSSFNAPFGRTGSIRIGRGRNAIEWLTIIGNPLAAAGIAT